jgi:hypothetical protein
MVLGVVFPNLDLSALLRLLFLLFLLHHPLRLLIDRSSNHLRLRLSQLLPLRRR